MKKNFLPAGIIALAAVIGFSIIGCGSDDSSNTQEQPVVTGQPTVTSVTVSPAAPNVVKGGSQTFTAAVAGTNNPAQTVTWSIDQTNKNEGTSISAGGVLTVAAAETLALLTVRAVSTADTSKSGTAAVTISGGSGTEPSAPESMSAKTAMQYFKDEGITIGINAGNSLDAVDNWTTPGKYIADETAWGNPKLNQAYFNGLASLGFKIVRVPVTWNGHIGDAPNYLIEEAYLKRVAEVVKYAKNAGLKCFINIHHDGNIDSGGHGLGGWLDINKAVAGDTSITDKFVKLWTQIAEYFKNYGDYLMFQGFNEIHDGSWKQSGSAAEYAVINDWNKKFTNAVRSTGSNNSNRYLLYYGYMVSAAIAVTDNSKFTLPADTASGKQIVGFHYYDPYEFSLGATSHIWDTPHARDTIENYFSAFKTKFYDNGIPVIIGENGPVKYASYPGNTGYNAANVETAKQNRLLFIDFLYGKARENGIVPFFWENGNYSSNAAEGDFSLINRNNGQPNSAESAEVIQRMIAAINNTTPPGQGGGGITPNPITGNLGNYSFGLQEDGVSPNYTLARWELSGASLSNAKTAGAKLVLVLQSAPTASLQLVWQGPSNSIWWKQATILGDNGNILNGNAASWNEGTKTLTLNLSSALDDYNSFIEQPSLNLIIAYYAGTSVNALGIVSANIVSDGDGGGEEPVDPGTPTNPHPFNDITASQLAAGIKVGWNLGNTLDAADLTWLPANPTIAQLETGWGNPVTTKAMITAIKNAGFNAIRIPVSWGKASDSNYNIRADWMARVTEVVNYAVDNDMYIILNTHHDEHIFKFTEAEKTASLAAFRKIWEQIADNFKNYNEKLIFEGLNEPRTKGSSNEWGGGTAAEHAVLNAHYPVFIDVVRKSGGNNNKRILMITTYAASSTSTAVNALVLPADTIANKLIVSVHAYVPYEFALESSFNRTTWSSSNPYDTAPINDAVDYIYNRFVSNNIPVIMGEFGAVNKNNLNARADWAYYYVNYAANKGIKCFWWDNGAFTAKENTDSFALLNRSNSQIVFPEIVTAMVNAAHN